MKRNLISTIIVIALIPLIFWTSCISEEKKLARQEVDSLAQVQAWKIDYYIDEFGDKTGKYFVETEVTGTFSNSYVSNEILYVEFVVDKKKSGIFLHERDTSSSAEKFIGTVTIRMKNSNGKILNIFTTDSWTNSEGIAIWDKDYYKIKNFLKRSVGEIRVVIQDEYSSHYNFTIDATGFTKEFSLL